MSKPVTNASYRKSRGTDKPFSNSEEQAQAIWAEQVRTAKWTSAKAAPAVKPPVKDGPVRS
ncbi:MAG: hypothetical protein MUC88_24035 [Planctomycetes bacterium]|jgi:hypothetical protein|nr:hypothetical protein [Planctomycetota bacterium]